MKFLTVIKQLKKHMDTYYTTTKLQQAGLCIGRSYMKVFNSNVYDTYIRVFTLDKEPINRVILLDDYLDDWVICK